MNPNNKWPNHQIDLCLKLADEGLTSAEIADKLNKTRNSVCGFMHRHKIRLKNGRGKRKKITIVNESNNVTHLQQTVKKTPVGYSKWGLGNVSEFPRIEPPQAPTPRFMDSCQYLAGCPRERKFCGQPVRKGTSWCENHRLLVFQSNHRSVRV